MDSTDLMNQVDLPDFEPPGRIRLEACPRCGYLLTGLPEQHRCPECGLEYDERTFVLTGISRGISSMSVGRKWGWIFVCLVAWLGPQLVFGMFFSKMITIFIIFLVFVWLGLIVYLLFTSRRERRGVENFVFTAGGFGYCADLDPTRATDTRMIPWPDVNAVVIDRKGSNWHRIRIGSRGSMGRRLSRVCFDVGVRCDGQTADWIDQVLRERIEAARQTTETERS